MIVLGEKGSRRRAVPRGEQFAQGHALLIGVGDDLPNTVTDAQGLGKILTDPERCAYPEDQVNVLTQEKANRTAILAELERLAHVDPESTVIVYFSGHGTVLKKERFEFLLHEWEREPTSERTLSGIDFTECLKRIPSKKLLVLLDCCWAGTLRLAKGVRAVPSPLPPEAFGLFTEGAGQVLIGSSLSWEPSEAAHEGKPYSAFTEALIEVLSGEGVAMRDGYVRVMDLTMYTARRVPELTGGRQHPTAHYRAVPDSDKFVVAYYAGGETAVKAFLFPHHIESKPGEFARRRRRWRIIWPTALASCLCLLALLSPLLCPPRNGIRVTRLSGVDLGQSEILQVGGSGDIEGTIDGELPKGWEIRAFLKRRNDNAHYAEREWSLVGMARPTGGSWKISDVRFRIPRNICPICASFRADLRVVAMPLDQSVAKEPDFAAWLKRFAVIPSTQGLEVLAPLATIARVSKSSLPANGAVTVDAVDNISGTLTGELPAGWNLVVYLHASGAEWWSAMATVAKGETWAMAHVPFRVPKTVDPLDLQLRVVAQKTRLDSTVEERLVEAAQNADVTPEIVNLRVAAPVVELTAVCGQEVATHGAGLGSQPFRISSECRDISLQGTATNVLDQKESICARFESEKGGLLAKSAGIQDGKWRLDNLPSSTLFSRPSFQVRVGLIDVQETGTCTLPDKTLRVWSFDSIGGSHKSLSN